MGGDAPDAPAPPQVARERPLPRDLADVLHYFLPELDAPGTPEEAPAPSERTIDAPEGVRPSGGGPPPAGPPDTPPLPVLGLPIRDRDVVRAALSWNLAVETSRLGGASVLLAPETDRGSPLWPCEGEGPLGCELLFCPAKDLVDLCAVAAELARARAARARHGGIVFVRIPPAWLAGEGPLPDALRWLLLLTSPRPEDANDAFELAHRASERQPSIEIGVTIHGVDRIAVARRAFESLLRRTQRELGQSLISYGLLVDDLDVYRAIAAQRPIGLAHPQAPASRALADVARLLYEDARSRVLG